jgi:uncharacterized membrane protein
MTTSWSLATQGRVVEAVETHAVGTLLAFAALVVGMTATVVAVRGRRLSWQPGDTTLAGLSVTLAALVVGEWIVRLLAR